MELLEYLIQVAGGAATVTGHGSAAQRRQFNQAAHGIGITVPNVGTHARTSASGTGLVHSGIVHEHTGDFVVNIDKEIARITKREIQKAMMAGA